MTFALILFASAFLISSVAAYYSVAGLVAIFSSATLASIVMGGALEAAKLVSASWLYRNWKEAPRLLKYYFTFAVIVLSVITSMGIFGYLSKAHLDQSVIIGGSADKVRILDEKIKVSKENIEQSRKALKQLDEAVDQTMARSTSEEGAGKATALRRSQQAERKRLLSDIEAEQKRVSVINEERLPLQAELTKIESEVGPIKYVAELVYGSSDEDMIGKAVRLMIILIILVFDPLAILLLIAANMEMRKSTPSKSVEEVANEKKEERVMEWTTSALTPRKPRKPVKPKKPTRSLPIKPKKPSKPKPVPKKKPTPKTPKKPVPKKRPVKKTTNDEDIVIKRSTVYRFDG
jgi:hypothetical protein